MEIERKEEHSYGKPKMDWNTVSTTPFVPHLDSSLSFLYNYNTNPYSGMEVSEMALSETQQRLLHVTEDEMNMIYNGNGYGEKKKKKLTSNQIDFLERCFQEDMKLDSKRKMKLSRELGLQPRQITVWFQNRRTRLKTKQLERSYDELKQENQKLQKEVMDLKEKLKEKAHFRTQTYGEETIENLEGLPCRNIEGEPYPCFNMTQATTSSIQQAAEGYDHSSFNVADFDSVSLFHECHWPNLPYYP
ncbi:homeobox-leucine zipper protein ATHB-22-like [Vicia villosa]|uniref:homeobox-leucine zipper protein ATHB-22-like n=1 Tax=Vicia villosa TaxID=3911 RepID=UPI00273CECB0|nr:homeobox-leucine zipper protein ATHB-22-like [Vicia villosa]